MILCLCPNPSIDTYVWLSNFEPGQVHRINKEQRYAGGKGVHVALAAAELGEEVKLLGFWGGPTGQWIKNICEQHGISCHGPEINEWSRTCLSFKSESQVDDTELIGCGPTVNKNDLEKFIKTFETLVKKADCVTMSGSWPEGAETDGYARLIEIANKEGKMTFLDCTGEQLLHALVQKPFAVHLNRLEGENYFKVKDPGHLAHLLSKNCTYSAITAGADGLYLTKDGELIHAYCKVDNVYSTVGSGDCLVAGLAVAYKRKMNLMDAARLAVACGGANCIRQDLGMLYKSDVEALQKRAISKKIIASTHD